MENYKIKYIDIIFIEKDRINVEIQFIPKKGKNGEELSHKEIYDYITESFKRHWETPTLKELSEEDIKETNEKLNNSDFSFMFSSDFFMFSSDFFMFSSDLIEKEKLIQQKMDFWKSVVLAFLKTGKQYGEATYYANNCIKEYENELKRLQNND